MDFILILAIIALIVLAAFILFVYLKPYFIHHDTITLFTGSLGCGKSFWTVKTAIVQLRKNRFKVFLKNINPIRRLIKKQPKIPKPPLLSTIPIRISLFEYSSPLDFNVFVLLERVPEYSVIVIDEINLFLSQMDYKIEAEEQINEFFTLYRHQTNGHIFMNTQNISKIHWIARYVTNRAYNLCEFRKPILGLPILAWVKCRNISISEDIKAVEQVDNEDGLRNMFAFFPLFRQYDSRCYSERYNSLPPYKLQYYKRLKRNSFIKVDKNKKYPKILSDTDEFSCGGERSEREKPTSVPLVNVNSNLTHKKRSYGVRNEKSSQ